MILVIQIEQTRKAHEKTHVKHMFSFKKKKKKFYISILAVIITQLIVFIYDFPAFIFQNFN